jgi:hypothetical protein
MRYFSRLVLSTTKVLSLRALSAQDLRPRAYVIAPVHSNAVILGYTFDDGSVFFGAVLPITNASGPYCVPNLTYYHSMNFMGVLRDRMGVHEDRFLATVFLAAASSFWR